MTMKSAFKVLVFSDLKDRDRHGGGVAVYVKNSIPYKSLQLIHQDLEAGPPVFLTPADTI